jgi:hypothetical protein
MASFSWDLAVGAMIGAAAALAVSQMPPAQAVLPKERLSEIVVPQAPPPQPAPVPVGRFQIVNGTPEMTQNIMLLDTLTGDSWVICNGGGGKTNRCRIEKSDSPGIRKSRLSAVRGVAPGDERA